MKKSCILFLCLLLCGPPALALAQTGDEREVIASGVGSTEDEAKKQAYRAAVQNVVGAMVLGETLVKNNDLVEEKILSYSHGYVTKAEQMGQTKALDGGLLSVTMKVTVRSDLLKEKLKAENVITKDADGDKFIAQLNAQRENSLARRETTQEAAKNAEAIITDAFKEWPAALIDATADFSQAKTVGEGDGSTVSVVIPVTVSVNQERYDQFVGQFKKTLNDLGLEYEAVTAPIKLEGLDYINGTFAKFRGTWPPDEMRASGKILLSINELVDFAGGQSRWKVYFLTKEIGETFDKIYKRRPLLSILVELLDVDGEVVVEQSFVAGANQSPIMDMSWSTVMHSGIGKGGNEVKITPILDVRIAYSRTDVIAAKSLGMVFEPAVVMTADELRRVKSIRCGVRNKAR